MRHIISIQHGTAAPGVPGTRLSAPLWPASWSCRRSRGRAPQAERPEKPEVSTEKREGFTMKHGGKW